MFRPVILNLSGIPAIPCFSRSARNLSPTYQAISCVAICQQGISWKQAIRPKNHLPAHTAAHPGEALVWDAAAVVVAEADATLSNVEMLGPLLGALTLSDRTN